MINPFFDKIGVYLHPKFSELKQYNLSYAKKTRRYLINKENLNIKTEAIHNLKNCKVLFVTNALGFCADLEKIKKICKKKKLF